MDIDNSLYSGEYYNILSQLPFNTIDQKLNLLIDDSYYELTEDDFFIFYNKLATYNIEWYINSNVKNKLVNTLYNLIHKLGSNKGLENVKFFNVLIPSIETATPLNVEYSISELANIIGTYKQRLDDVHGLIDICYQKDTIIEQKNLEISKVTNSPVYLNLLEIVNNLTNKMKNMYDNIETPYTKEHLDNLIKYMDVLQYKEMSNENNKLLLRIKTLESDLELSSNTKITLLIQIEELNTEINNMKFQASRLNDIIDEGQNKLDQKTNELLNAQIDLNHKENINKQLIKAMHKVEDLKLIEIPNEVIDIHTDDEAQKLKSEIIHVYKQIMNDLTLIDTISKGNSISLDNINVYEILSRLNNNITIFMIKIKQYFNYLNTKHDNINNKILQLENIERKIDTSKTIQNTENISSINSLFGGINDNLLSIIDRSHHSLVETPNTVGHNKTVIDNIHKLAIETQSQLQIFQSNIKDYFVNNGFDINVALMSTIQEEQQKFSQLLLKYQQIMKEMDSCKTHNMLLENNIIDAKGQINQLEKRLIDVNGDNIYAIYTSNERMKIKINELTNENVNNQLELERIQKEHDDQIDRLLSKNHNLENQTNQELIKKNREIEELNNIMYDMNISRIDAIERLEHCTHRNVELLKDKNKLDAEVLELKEDLETEQNTIKKLRRNLDEYHLRLSSMDEEGIGYM